MDVVDQLDLLKQTGAISSKDTSMKERQGDVDNLILSPVPINVDGQCQLMHRLKEMLPRWR